MLGVGWGLSGGCLGVEQIFGGWVGVDWGLSEKSIWRRARICQECMIYIIGQENVLLKQARGDRTLKMHYF